MRSFLVLLITCLVASVAADEPAAPESDAAYARALEKRAGDVLDVLKLDDPAKAARVREAVINQYRGLRRLHDERDANLKSFRERPHAEQQSQAERERTDAAARALHQRFLATLSADLSPDQVDRVKDKMTYDKLRVTYEGYLEMLPDLTPEQRRAILDRLKEAREEAMDAGSAEEKSAIFNRYKGRINNYLAAQGYDLKLASKLWAERRKRAK